jgi:hypothetical protein
MRFDLNDAVSVDLEKLSRKTLRDLRAAITEVLDDHGEAAPTLPSPRHPRVDESLMQSLAEFLDGPEAESLAERSFKWIRLLRLLYQNGGRTQIQNMTEEIWGHSLPADSAVNNLLKRMNRELEPFGFRIGRKAGTLMLKKS